MPCWYYSKKDLKNTPSLRDGIDTATETRYRREGARFIIDTGTKMGLRYDTCATGVVYFHRFYMFHSFREFHRYVTSACCLFLAGKVEETPKKCKDIIKITSSMLTDEQFMVFGKDPKEEIMTLERILLQTMKFDLQVEHPYAYLLKFAKIIKGDKAKIQKMVQMAWTFINDSLCTMLCLQWESDIVGVALIYLAGRLTKYDINDWVGKQPGVRIKWYEHLVEDVTLELLEDICHQVLDLYSPSQQKRDDSPPPPPPPRPSNHPPSMTHNLGQPPGMTTKRARSPSTGRAGPPGQPTPAKSSRRDGGHSKSPGKKDTLEKKLLGATKPGSTHGTPGSAGHPLGYTSNNPYVNSQMYSSSFMSQEGAQSIQTLVGNTPATAAAPPAPPFSAYNPAVPPPVPAYSQPPPAVAPPTASSASQPQTTATQYSQQGGYPASGYPPGYQAQSYQASQYQQSVQQQGAGYSHSQQTGQQYQNTSYGSQTQHSQSQSQYSHYGQQYQQQYPNQQQQQQPQQQQQQPQQQSQYANQYSGQQQYAQSGQPYSSYSNQNYGHTQQGQGYQPPPPGTHQQQYQS